MATESNNEVELREKFGFRTMTSKSGNKTVGFKSNISNITIKY